MEKKGSKNLLLQTMDIQYLTKIKNKMNVIFHGYFFEFHGHLDEICVGSHYFCSMIEPS